MKLQIIILHRSYIGGAMKHYKQNIPPKRRKPKQTMNSDESKLGLRVKTLPTKELSEGGTLDFKRQGNHDLEHLEWLE